MITLLAIGLLAGLFYFLEIQLYKRLWNQDLYASAAFGCAELFVGEEGELVEVVENRKRLPLPMLKVRFQTDRNLRFADMRTAQVTDRFYRNDVFQVGGGERIIRRLKFVGKKRGYYTILGIDLISSDLFYEVQLVDSRESESAIYIYPRPFITEDLMRFLRSLNGDVQTRKRFLEDPFEHWGIREYQPFDELRSVNWKATAKTGALKVNQCNDTQPRQVRLFYNIEEEDTWKQEESAEGALRIVTTVADFFLQAGIMVSLDGNAIDGVQKTSLHLGPGAGPEHLHRLLQTLARLEIIEEPAAFDALLEKRLFGGQRGAVNVIVARVLSEAAYETLHTLQAMGESFYLILPLWAKEKEQTPAWVRPYLQVVYMDAMKLED